MHTHLKQKEFLSSEIQRCDEKNTLRWTLLFVQGEGANKLVEDISQFLQEDTVSTCYLCKNGQNSSLRLISEIRLEFCLGCMFVCLHRWLYLWDGVDS